MASMNRAFLLGKSRNRYGWLIPARLAMVWVLVPSSPPWANSIIAARSTASRRCSAVCRMVLVGAMQEKLVIGHSHVNPVSRDCWAQFGLADALAARCALPDHDRERICPRNRYQIRS